MRKLSYMAISKYRDWKNMLTIHPKSRWIFMDIIDIRHKTLKLLTFIENYSIVSIVSKLKVDLQTNINVLIYNWVSITRKPL